MANYRKIWAMKKQQEERFKKFCPDIQNQSGIYVWYRSDENGYTYFYAGQSIKLVDRSVSHLQAYDHLGLSIRKYGLYSAKNPYGWKFKYYYCGSEDLDDYEQKTIKAYIEEGWVSYNITGGSQGKGKFDIHERKPTKGYREGVEQGKKTMLEEIKVYFQKYLDFAIKGDTTKVKERKLKEFSDLLTKNWEE